MKFMNKMGKTTLASSIVAASVLSTVNVSMLQAAQNKVLKLSKHKTKPLLSATQKSKMSSSWLAMVWDLLLTLHIAIIK